MFIVLNIVSRAVTMTFQDSGFVISIVAIHVTFR